MTTSPSGYERDYLVPIPHDECWIALGFDVQRGRVQRFLVQLQAVAPDLELVQQIARVDHNPANPAGHDVRTEGIHVDVVMADGREVTLYPDQPTHVGEANLGSVIDTTANYFRRHADYFLEARRSNGDPTDPPAWP